MQTKVLFIPCTLELQNDINAILAQPGVEYVDMKVVPPSSTEDAEYARGGVWLVFRQMEGTKPLV